MAVDPATYEESPGATEGEGISILRADASTAVLRQRLERPSRLGMIFFLILGAIVAAAGFLLFFSSRQLIDLPIGFFGAILMLLGGAQHFLLKRDRENWPDKAFLWDGGIELMLHNGDVRGLSWTDPDLAFSLVARPARAPVNREYLLIWLRDKNVPTIELSEDGFHRVRQIAEDRRLNVTENRKGRDAKLSQWILIQPYQLGQGSSSKAEVSETPVDLSAPP
jgi:hypothetical protein